jgi:hypothetical protein
MKPFTSCKFSGSTAEFLSYVSDQAIKIRIPKSTAVFREEVKGGRFK